MDGSVQNNRMEYASLADADKNGTLRQRVKVPENIVHADLESDENMEKSNMKQNRGDTNDEYAADENDIRTLPRNTFSFLIIARYPFCEKARPDNNDDRTSIVQNRRKKKHRDYLCIPFWISLGILVLQITIYTLALLNATDFGDDNPFNFPIDVDPSTRAAELFAVMITVYTENNLFQGVDLFVQSFDTLVETPGVTFYKYYMTATAAVLVGLYGIFVTFIIIMQAESVVDLLLDFTAMEFVAALDDASYVLSIGGFLGSHMKLTARVVKDSKYASKDKRKWLRKWPLFVLFAAVMTCYVIVRVNQGNRTYGDNEIYVQFHDEVHPWLSTLSGVYIGCNLPSSDHASIIRGKDHDLGRTMYTKLSVAECERNWKAEHGAFFYCDEKHWVFAVGENKMDPCNKWIMQSIKPKPSNTDEYDILSHSTEVWLAKDPERTFGTGVVEQIQFLAGFQSSQNAGRNCSVLASTGNVFSYPFYARLEESQQEKSFASERPVYFAGDDTDGEYIFHTGRRWVVVKANQIPSCVRNCNTAENCCKLDPYSGNYTVSFISDPMDLRTLGDTWIPTAELIWYKATGDTGNSSKPIVERQSLVDQIDVIEALSSVGSFPNREEEERLIDLHLQSARLSCLCDSGDLECEKNVACGADETTVWIDLQTDSRPQDTYFIVMGNETWGTIQEEAATSYDFSSVRQLASSENFGITPLNDTGYFDWQDVRETGFAAKANYQFTTCLPKNKCGIIYAEDTAGNGITFPGRFNVFLNTRKVERDRGGRKCVYDLCQESATCSDSSLRKELFNPEISCTDESVPLAFQFFKDTSFSLSNTSQWLSNAEGEELYGSGPVEWGSLFFDAQRQIWNNFDFVDFDAEIIFSPIRTATCLPKSSCAIVAFDILDVPFESLTSEDTGFPFEFPSIVYNGIALEPDEVDPTFNHCVYQFGDPCATEVICSDTAIPRPYTTESNCAEGQKALAIEVVTDMFGAETSLVMTDLDTWRNGQLTGFTPLLETGTFDWGFLRWNAPFVEESVSYTFDSCVPDDQCWVVLLGDAFRDGIVNGGMTLVYDNADILFGPLGDAFTTCVFQFGDCEAKLDCYDIENPLPPYNPEIECQSGKPLAFELRADCCSSGDNAIVVTDSDSWNQGLASTFPFVDAQGFFNWGSFNIFAFENNVSNRFQTCVPDEVCAIVAINDSFGDGFVGLGGLTVVYDNTETMLGPQVDDQFTDCVFQIGACETQFFCENSNTPLPTSPPSPPTTRPPAFNPDINCPGGKSLAFEFYSDTTVAVHTITVADFYSWRRGILSNAASPNDFGYFEWDSVEISNFESGTIYQYSTCVPDTVCGIVALEDNFGDGFDSNDWFTVYYDREEILAAFATESFRTCQYQFGSSCGQQGSCTASLPPPYNPEMECFNGTSLALDFHSDFFPSDNDLLVTDWDSWVQDTWANSSSSILNQTGFFEWGTVQISGFDPSSSHHFRTCVPSEVCGVVVLRDSIGDGIFSDEGLRVVFDEEEIPMFWNPGGRFSFCEFQFGSCGQGAYCTSDPTLAPSPFEPNGDDGAVQDDGIVGDGVVPQDDGVAEGDDAARVVDDDAVRVLDDDVVEDAGAV
ncbi:unnamed protein product [Cylindrotheca closterium]|uniref:Uncharacterized protein n=1 Tax=Cylindrotheca closterium TaxID=2856 RepID=A0AAD2FKS0_9STRA|nr:unnamed protein product [Cylindrotheca closterium]